MEKFCKLFTYIRTTVYPSVMIYLLIAYFNWDIAWIKLSLSHAMIMFATCVVEKLAKGKDTEGYLFEVMAVKCGLSKAMKSAAN